METQFGKAPHERAAEARTGGDTRVKRGKKSDGEPDGNEPRYRWAIVDSEKEIAVQVMFSTMIFRPNQKIDLVKEHRLHKIAEDNGIPLRYRE